MRQDLVFHLDQFQRGFGGLFINGRNRGDGMTVVKGLGPRHAIVEDRKKRRIAIGQIGQIGSGDDGLDALDSLGARGVDSHDAGMGMRAAQHAGDQLARHIEIGPVAGAPRDLVHAIRAQGPCADGFQRLALVSCIETHARSPLMSCAAS